MQQKEQMDPNKLNMGQDQRQQQLQKQEEQKQQIEDYKQTMLNQILKAEAKERLNRIKLVKPENAEKIEVYLINAAKVGQIQGKVSEEQLIQLLEKLSGSKSETKIQFKRRGIDDEF